MHQGDGVFFTNNRRQFTEKIRGEVAVFSAYSLMQRTSDLASRFEQESNFWWLCGVELPGWWLVIDASRSKSWLISPSVVGSTIRTDQEYEHIQRESGVDMILTQDAGMQLIRDLSKKHSIARTLGNEFRGDQPLFTLNPAQKKMYDMLNRMFNTVQDCRRELAQLRAIKRPEEVARIKKIISVVSGGFEHIRSEIDSFKYEYEIEAALAYHFRKHGAKGVAYETVVASGRHACDLQYVANQERLKKREVVLVDAGARMGGYSSSVARMYSRGEPTQRQRAIHDALAHAQSSIIELLEPHLPVDQYQRKVDIIMKEMLMKLNLMNSPDDTSAYRRYMPHVVSHGVGVDVHDNLGSPHFFRPNMVVAVEPGVYIPEEGIGMRLHDVVHITESGPVNLSKRLSTDL